MCQNSVTVRLASWLTGCFEPHKDLNRNGLVHGNRDYVHLRRHFSGRGHTVLCGPLCPPANHHRLYCAWYCPGALRARCGVRYGARFRSGPRRHHIAAVPARAGYETDRPLEQPEAIHAGGGLECSGLRRNRLRIKSFIWLCGNGCSADQRRARVLFHHHWHQAAAHHCAAPPAFGRDDDRSAAISGSACHHCVGDDGERGDRGPDLACAASTAADIAAAGTGKLAQR